MFSFIFTQGIFLVDFKCIYYYVVCIVIKVKIKKTILLLIGIHIPKQRFEFNIIRTRIYFFFLSQTLFLHYILVLWKIVF